MSEHLYDVSPEMTQWVTPDDTGFTVRTRYRDTQQVLERNRQLRNEAPQTFRADGVDFHHACSIPAEIVDMLHRKLGRAPTAKELIALSQDRDFNRLKTRDVTL